MKGRRHGSQDAADERFLLFQDSSLPDLREAGMSEGSAHARGAVDRVSRDRDLGSHLRGVSCRLRVLPDVLQFADGGDARCLYDNQVRDTVLERLIEDGLSIPRILAAMRRDFFLDLFEGFVYDCIQRRVAELDHADDRRWTLAKVRGTLCLDELHLGRHTLLLATDPIGDFPVAFAIVDGNDAEHMQRFLASLQRHASRPTTPRPAQEVGSQTPWSDAEGAGPLRVPAATSDRDQ